MERVAFAVMLWYGTPCLSRSQRKLKTFWNKVFVCVGVGVGLCQSEACMPSKMRDNNNYCKLIAMRMCDLNVNFSRKKKTNSPRSRFIVPRAWACVRSWDAGSWHKQSRRMCNSNSNHAVNIRIMLPFHCDDNTQEQREDASCMLLLMKTYKWIRGSERHQHLMATRSFDTFDVWLCRQHRATRI